MHLSAKHPRARAQRIISYVLTAVFVAIGTVILTRYTQGFQIDPETRSLVQNGLVLIQTEPVDASITIDGQSSGKQTPNRVTLPVGEHSVELNAEGYRTWSKNFTVLGSDLIWLNYPLLVPTEVVTTNDSVLGVAPLIGASPDKRTLLSQTATAGNFLLFDIDEETTSEVVLAAPANVATALTDKTVQSISFGNNNRYALITAANDTATSFVYVDTERPEQSVVANELFEGEYTAMQLDSEDERNVYGLQNGILYRLNLDNQERSEALAENVLQFNSQAGFVSIIQTTQRDGEASSRFGILNSRDEILLIGEALRQTPYVVVHSVYDGDAIASVSDANNTTVYSRVTSRSIGTPLSLGVGSSETAFSGNGRFLSVRTGVDVTTVDLEFDDQFSFTLPSEPSTRLNWINNFQISAVIDGNAVLMDYDGNNQQSIVSASNNLAPVTNRDDSSLFTTQVSGDAFVLQRSELVVNN